MNAPGGNNRAEKAMKHVRAVESDSVKPARKAIDKLHKADRPKFVSELCIGRNKTECAWQARVSRDDRF